MSAAWIPASTASRSRRCGLDEPEILETFAHRMMYSAAKDEHTATDYDIYQALAYTVRDRLMERVELEELRRPVPFAEDATFHRE